MAVKGASPITKKNNGLLVTFARTIGSTLGTVAAKTEKIAKPARKRTPVKKSKKSGTKVKKTAKKKKA